MEIIAKISKGSKMDQIYIPKQRQMLNIGEYVVIRPLSSEREKTKQKSLYFYRINQLEPVKIALTKEIIDIIEKNMEVDNIFITGSFLNKGFNFKDIDVLIVGKKAVVGNKSIEKLIYDKIKINVHLISFNSISFRRALETDPIWRLMVSKSISKKRRPPLPERKMDYIYLDSQLIRSKTFLDGFDLIGGSDKYKLARNLVAIYLFIKNKPLSDSGIEKTMVKELGSGAESIKNNLIDRAFLRKYRNFYLKLEKEIIKNASKQKKVD